MTVGQYFKSIWKEIGRYVYKVTKKVILSCHEEKSNSENLPPPEKTFRLMWTTVSYRGLAGSRD